MENINNMKEKKQGTISDIFPLILESGSNIIAFTTGLVTHGIIS
jgi:hypothetical protein